MKRVCNDHHYCHVEMPNEENKILKYHYGEKSLKVPFVINIDTECLLEKRIVHFMHQKASLIVTEEKTLKGFVMI